MWFCYCCCLPSCVFLYNHHPCARKRQHMMSQWSEWTIRGHRQNGSHLHIHRVFSVRGRKWQHMGSEGALPQKELMKNSAGAIYLAEIQNTQENPIWQSSSKIFLFNDNSQCWQDCWKTSSSHREWILVYTLQSIIYQHISIEDAMIFLCPESSFPLLTAQSLFLGHSSSNSLST